MVLWAAAGSLFFAYLIKVESIIAPHRLTRIVQLLEKVCSAACALALSLNAQIGDCTFACETSSEFCGVGKKKPIPVIVIRRKNIRGPVPKNTEQECDLLLRNLNPQKRDKNLFR